MKVKGKQGGKKERAQREGLAAGGTTMCRVRRGGVRKERERKEGLAARGKTM